MSSPATLSGPSTPASLGKMWGKERARQMLGEAGFEKLRFVRIPSDPLRCSCVAQK
jgi:hypothetical protein